MFSREAHPQNSISKQQKVTEKRRPGHSMFVNPSVSAEEDLQKLRSSDNAQRQIHGW